MASFVIIANFSQLNFIIVCSFFFFLGGVESPRISNFFLAKFLPRSRIYLFSANFFILISPQQTEVTYSLQTLFHRSSRILTYSLQSFLFLFHRSRQKSLILCKPYFTAAAEYSLILCNLFYTIFINSLIQSPLNTLCSVTSNF